MKKFFVSLVAWCSMSALAFAGQVPLTGGIIDQGSTGNDAPRMPIRVPSASIEGYTFTVSSHPDYVLQLVDPDAPDIIYYEDVFPEGTNSIELPSSLSGDYEIRLVWGNWYFYGLVSL